MKNRILVCLLLTISLHCCFGQTDTNVLAVGEWSAPVTNSIWPLRGRLVIYDPEASNGDRWPHGRIYLELQNVLRASAPPVEFYFDRHMSCLRFEMRDGEDKLIPGRGYFYVGPAREPVTMTLRSESTLRVRVDLNGDSRNKPDGLVLATSNGVEWTVPLNATNDYYLSATFSPTNNPSALNYHVWEGTLKLPKLRIPIEKIKKP